MAQAYSPLARGLMNIMSLPEAASQTYAIGDWLILDSNGRLQQAAAAGASVAASSGVRTNKIVGRAVDAASGTTGKMRNFMVAEPGTHFALPFYHATPGTAVPSTANNGIQYGLIHVDATVDYYGVDVAGTTDVKLKQVDVVLEDHTAWNPGSQTLATAASTTQYGLVWCEFLSEHCIFGGGV
jgi:hypothetical protein